MSFLRLSLLEAEPERLRPSDLLIERFSGKSSNREREAKTSMNKLLVKDLVTGEV